METLTCRQCGKHFKWLAIPGVNTTPSGVCLACTRQDVAPIDPWDGWCRQAGLSDPTLTTVESLGASHKALVGRVVADAVTRATTPLAQRPRSLGVMLLGPTGVGKTHWMMSVGRAIHEAGVPLEQIRFGREADTIAPEGGTQWKPRNLKGWLSGARVVIVDELGRGLYPDGAGGQNALAAWCDLMIQRRLLVIAASNAADFHAPTRADHMTRLGTIEGMVGPHVFSRMQELFTMFPHVGEYTGQARKDWRAQEPASW